MFALYQARAALTLCIAGVVRLSPSGSDVAPLAYDYHAWTVCAYIAGCAHFPLTRRT